MGIDCGFARPDEKERLKSLWCTAFGDPPDFAEDFWQRFYAPEHVPVLRADGLAEAALYCIDCSLRRGSRIFPAYYVYAAAVFPFSQGRGFGTELLDFAFEEAKRHRRCGLVLLPGSGTLYNFYASRGFRSVFHRRPAPLPPDAVPRSRPSYEEYLAAQTQSSVLEKSRAFYEASIDIFLDGGGRIMESPSAGGIYFVSGTGETVDCWGPQASGERVRYGMIRTENAVFSALTDEIEMALLME